MTRLEKAHIFPFAAFMLLLGLMEGIDHVCEGAGPFWLAAPMYWIFPSQALLCGALLAGFWREYDFQQVRNFILTISTAILVLLVWIAPQEILGMPRRVHGFDPTLFAGNQRLFVSVLSLRFFRLVLVVPLLEEIFWRGYLLRRVAHHHFEKIPFGSFDWRSFGIVTLFFGLAHWGPDFVPALVTGALYNFIACRTRSLASCIVAHSVTNLLLGVYILQTRQWGFW
jgi:CAAX prenyl protease-like protein